MSFFLGYSNGALAFLAGSALIAGLARGFSGFGGALIFVPLASSVVGPRLAAPLLLIVDAVAASGLIPNAWRRAARREVGTMAAGALLGVPLGALLLARADPLSLRWALAAIVAMFLVLLVSGWRYHGRRSKPVTAGVGLIAGLLSGSAQIGGPPIVAYWLSSPLGAEVVRANLVLYFAISGLLSGLAYVAGGVLTHAVLVLALVVSPAYGLGIFLGSRMFGLASDTVFRRICLALIAVATIVSLPVLDQALRR